MMRQEEVKQFIIVAPTSRKNEIACCRERLADYLARCFPRYALDVAKLAPVRDEDHFIPIPVMSYRPPDGDSLMCKPVEKWVLREIADACADFKPHLLLS
ncbi:hypothetical protein FJV80_24715 [Mesorhizobium sp. WSM4310]|uniref:hypothetical protein n=1 Tax=Mesorhizobium sp. WSM4310 TaxID=2589883 RepID=UPI00115E34DE|nr:hypothetical protein [Mesorhizobium sp. WSM4310]TRC78547.1 hypothetical protein FJV80_24715 [Mesorhizobium sp. WSM4310]